MAMRVEVGQLAIEEYKRHVEAVSLGVAGIFVKDLLPKFFERVDGVISRIDAAKGMEEKTKEEVRRQNLERSMQNMAKLEHLFARRALS